jgi:hypothetical protein
MHAVFREYLCMGLILSPACLVASRKEASRSADYATFTDLNSEWFLDVYPGRVHRRQPGEESRVNQAAIRV